MGCRTRANEYYGRLAQETVEGNVVRKAVPYVDEPAPAPAPVRISRERKFRQNARMQRILHRQKVRFIVLGTVAGAVLLGLCVCLLFAIKKNGTLNQEVAKTESAIQELTIYNDAREYEISSSVDLNYVIDVATNELGMVRSNASQIVTYRVKNTEYLQQVAQVPQQ